MIRASSELITTTLARIIIEGSRVASRDKIRAREALIKSYLLRAVIATFRGTIDELQLGLLRIDGGQMTVTDEWRMIN